MKVRFVDFDRDGANDLFTLNGENILTAIFTSDIRVGGIALNDLSTPTANWAPHFSDLTSGDFNEDGFLDIAGYEDFNAGIYPPFGAVRIYYGFRPLRNPSVSLLPRTVPSPRATVALAVEGNSTEMNPSGDIVDAFKDQWTPFQNRRDVVFTANESNKTVTARFRNAVGRESETAEASTVVAVGSPGIVTGTNRLRAGGTAAFDCHVEGPGSLRARIYDAEGAEVRELMNREVDRGVYPVTWNGGNAFDRRVARGVYYLVLEVNGERVTKKLLVE